MRRAWWRSKNSTTRKRNYDAAEAQLKSLEEQVNQQQVELHYYKVAAPMDGIVGDIPVRIGDRVAVTTLLTTVDEPGALEVYIYVPADRAQRLEAGRAGASGGCGGARAGETRE